MTMCRRTKHRVTKVEMDPQGCAMTHVLTATNMCPVKCTGMCMAVGEQQGPQLMKLSGEESFTGTISRGIQERMPVDKFKGLVVVIVGGGAFACENLRTALRQWAEHVTVIHRTALQCW